MSFDSIIRFSIRNKLVISLFVAILTCWGIYALSKLPIDAVPDITTNQVVVLSQTPALAAQEVEQYITTPLELSLTNVQGVTEIRSVSRLGLSVITVVFEDHMDILKARQLVGEQISLASQDIPSEFGKPYLAPITTGLGEIYQYTLVPQPGYETKYSLMELRTIQDWIVKRQLTGIPGVVEISSFGGYVKEYEVSVNPERLRAAGVTVAALFEAVQQNNSNTGGSYLEKGSQSYFIRGEGTVKDLDDIRNIVIRQVNGVPLLVRHVAEVKFGHAVRYGAMTRNGESEAVGAVVLMLKGADAGKTVALVKDRMDRIQQSLPEGIKVESFIDREKLISKAIKTVRNNLLEGGLIVVFVLVVLLGSLRAGLIVASVIPLSMLFTFGMMHTFGVSANLMSLGAIDFGLVVDGSVIVVEGVLHYLHGNYKTGDKLTAAQMDETVEKTSSKILNSAIFGQIIILIVYLPILSLSGIEGKMFQPMALAVSFAILGALILSLTYVPMISAFALPKKISNEPNFSDKLVNKLFNVYKPIISKALHFKKIVVGTALVIFVGSIILFNSLGGEFIPQLDEGDIAIDLRMPTGTSLTETIEASLKAERVLLKHFPEINQIVGRIGASEIPTDPMPVEMTDQMINLKDRSLWTSAKTREELSEKMNQVLEQEVPGVMTEFTQPIQMRANEMITGARSDVVVKIYGDDLDKLFEHANASGEIITKIEGVASCRVEPIVGLPQIKITYRRDRLAQYGLNIGSVNQLINTSFAGQTAGVVFEGERRFNLSIRLDTLHRKDLHNIQDLHIPLLSGGSVPISEVAEITYEEAPAQISRDNTKRRITIGINVQNRDVESVVKDIQEKLSKKIELTPGYYFTYGGQFENLQQARQRLSIAVPISLLLIFMLLYFTFGRLTEALIIFTAVPLSAIGGIWALWVRDMPFSISAGVGFIALFGVAVLNGIVLISYFDQLHKENEGSLYEQIMRGVQARFRPVIMTASVASLGFLPMALSTSAGAEVQRPLATVVIGGLITATLLTLIVLPVLYNLIKGRQAKKKLGVGTVGVLLIIFSLMPSKNVEAQRVITLDEAIQTATSKNLAVQSGLLQIEQQEKLVGTSFNPQKMNADVQYGQTQSKKIDYTTSISQSFAPTSVYKAQKKLLEGQVVTAKNMLTLEQLRIATEVKRSYYQLLYGEQLVRLLATQRDLYQRSARAAEIRFKTGESNRLEMITAESKLLNLIQRMKTVKRDQEIYISSLKLLLQTNEPIAVDTQTVFKRVLTGNLLSQFDNQTHPVLNVLQQNVENSRIQTKLDQKNGLPDWRVGLINQSIDRSYSYNAVMGGLSFNLFSKAQRAKVQSAKLKETVLETELLHQRAKLTTELEQLQKRQNTLTDNLQYYETSALPHAELIHETALKSYESGEIGYVEFFAALQQAFQFREEYLSVVLDFDMNLIGMEEIIGKHE